MEVTTFSAFKSCLPITPLNIDGQSMMRNLVGTLDTRSVLLQSLQALSCLWGLHCPFVHV